MQLRNFQENNSFREYYYFFHCMVYANLNNIRLHVHSKSGKISLPSKNAIIGKTNELNEATTSALQSNFSPHFVTLFFNDVDEANLVLALTQIRVKIQPPGAASEQFARCNLADPTQTSTAGSSVLRESKSKLNEQPSLRCTHQVDVSRNKRSESCWKKELSLSSVSVLQAAVGDLRCVN
jgi:hypothetical protein